MDWSELRQQHMLDPEEIYLNTGSFGSLHQRTFDHFVEGLRTVEENPTTNYGVLRERVDEAREFLGRFLGSPPEDLAFTLNVTASMSMAILGLDWRPGDEILASDSEYGAIDHCLHHVEQREGLTVRRAPVRHPPDSPDEIIESFASSITDRTRLLVCSHIFSRTGCIAPIADLARLAHSHGALIAIDGAHAAGMIPIDLAATGCDLYGGNCHKWLCSPKGAGFLYASPSAQPLLHHIVVGWGYSPEGPTRAADGGLHIGENPFMWGLELWGSRDQPSLAAVRTAVEIQEEIGRERIADRGRELAAYLRECLVSTGWARPLTPASHELSGSLAAYHLSGFGDVDLRRTLQKRYRITAPSAIHEDGHWMRVSTHYYNQPHELDTLVWALQEIRHG